MAKITLDTITSSFASTSLFNTNFSAIKTELDDKVLYRNNPDGEANQMENDLDMNSNDILNAKVINSDIFILGGTQVVPSGTSELPSLNVSYDNSTSGLTATTAQDAIDEVDADLDVAQASLVQGSNHGKNLIINGDFSVNQRAVSGTVVLSSGDYGHDRMKAGSGGCTYTFAKSSGVTTITITAGTLLQIVEATDMPASAVVLSWIGTATGRIDSGSYGATGTVTATTTGGTNFQVEFTTGTLSHIQLEAGTIVTDFEITKASEQLANCKRYFLRRAADAVGHRLALGMITSVATVTFLIPITTPMRVATPSITLSASSDWTIAQALTNTAGTDLSVATPCRDAGGELEVLITNGTGTLTITTPAQLRANSSTAFIDISAEL